MEVGKQSKAQLSNYQMSVLCVGDELRKFRENALKRSKPHHTTYHVRFAIVRIITLNATSSEYLSNEIMYIARNRDEEICCLKTAFNKALYFLGFCF